MCVYLPRLRFRFELVSKWLLLSNTHVYDERWSRQLTAQQWFPGYRGGGRTEEKSLVSWIKLSSPLEGNSCHNQGRTSGALPAGKKGEFPASPPPSIPPPPPPPLSNCFSEVQTGHKFRGKANLKQTNQLGRWRRGIKICVFYVSGERELLTEGYWRRRNGLLYDVSTPIPSLKKILPIIACTGRLRWKGGPCSGFR